MKLKVLLWNLQDFFLFMDKYQGEDLADLTEAKFQLLTTSFKSNKELEKVRAIAELIENTAPDICLFTEVGGKESLDNFNKYFLNQRFQVIHEPSNSDRGIDLAIMVRSDLPLPYNFQLHKDKVFARGALELILTYNNINLHILLTHLKSKLNLKGQDFEGRTQREAEVFKLLEIGKKIIRDPKSRLIICGDFNGIIAKDSDDHELRHFANKLRLTDVMEVQKIPFFERSTYIYYNNGEDRLMQLDYFLIQESYTRAVGTETKVLDFCGRTRVSFPKNRKEKMSHPSDHYPIQVELEMDKLL